MEIKWFVGKTAGRDRERARFSVYAQPISGSDVQGSHRRRGACDGMCFFKDPDTMRGPISERGHGRDDELCPLVSNIVVTTFLALGLLYRSV